MKQIRKTGEFKKNKRFIQFIIIGLLSLLTSFSKAAPQQGTAIKTLVIDPGHGGTDPGAIGPLGHHEANLALAVSLKFGALVEKYFKDTRVVYTRKTDVFVSLNDRAEIANKAKADLFFCIHLNAEPKHTAYGSSTYALGLHRTDENLEVAKRENAVIDLEQGGLKNYDFNPNSPEGHIIMSMKQNAFLDQSLKIASLIEDEQAAVAKRKTRGVKQAGFYVLYKTSMPSILTEIGFISNATEAQFLASENGQKLVAASLFRAFVKYKNNIEGKDIDIDLSDYIPTGSKEILIEDKTEPTKTAPLENKTTVVTKEDNKSEIAESTTPTPGVRVVKADFKPVESTVDSSTLPKYKKEQLGTGSQINFGQFNISKKTVKSDSTNSTGNIPETSVKSSSTTSPTETRGAAPNKVAPVKTAVSSENKEPVFRIQLSAAMVLPKNAPEITAKFGKIYTEKLPNGVMRIMVGNFSTAVEVKAELNNVHAAGFKDAFIAVYENGKRADNIRLNDLLK
jgi:N-acetylmuramoyl-L-alanine amidase